MPSNDTDFPALTAADGDPDFNRAGADSATHARANAKFAVDILENLPDAVLVFDSKGFIRACNSAAPRMFGFDPDGMVGRKVDMLFAQDGLFPHGNPAFQHLWAGKAMVKETGPHEMTGKRNDGATFPLELAVGRMEHGDDVLFIGTFRNLSRHKVLDSEQAEKSALLTTTFDIIAQGYAVYDHDLRLIQYNTQFEAIFAFPPGFLRRGITRKEIVRFRAERGDYGPGDVEEVIARVYRETGTPGERTRERTLSTGTVYIYHRKTLPGGGAVITYTDITSLRHAEREAANYADLLGKTIAAMAQACVVYDSAGCLIAYNKQFEKLFGFPRGFLHPGRTISDVIRFRLLNGPTLETLSGSGDIEEEVAYHLRRLRKQPQFIRELCLADGTTHIYSRMPMSEGGIVCTYTDVTEIRKTERALRDTETLLHLLADASPALISYIDRDRIIRFANKALAARYGMTPEDMVGQHQTEYWGKDQHEDIHDQIDRTLAGETTMSEAPRTYADGTVHDHLTSRAPHFSENGEVLGYFNISLDITDQKRAEEALWQAQKMETVGQLTGGIAHDFNNLLAVIQGSAELLAEKGAANDRLLRSIIRAAKRGAELTQHLLAFSRRQPLRPQSLDLAALVSNLSDVLNRTLGENIEIETWATENLWSAQADHGQVESALLNLAINARDAMPEGGKLTIACANVLIDQDSMTENAEITPGDYVVLAVADNGTGMPEDVLARVFEPFYTTKDVGQGSGLGLSMVYGFAKQSGGSVGIESKVGQGTTVKLYLPRAVEAQVSAPPEAARIPGGHGERILVLEDDADVRSLVDAMLKRLNYKVTIAATASEALDALQRGTVDLLLSDVVLAGGISGPELAARARAWQPDLKVVFMSGYAADATIDGSRLGTDEVLLSKPFQKYSLARALRRALEPHQAS